MCVVFSNFWLILFLIYIKGEKVDKKVSVKFFYLFICYYFNFITPPDVTSQLILSIAIIFSYEFFCIF
jgi:hypothetical protein